MPISFATLSTSIFEISSSVESQLPLQWTLCPILMTWKLPDTFLLPALLFHRLLSYWLSICLPFNPKVLSLCKSDLFVLLSPVKRLSFLVISIVIPGSIASVLFRLTRHPKMLLDLLDARDMTMILALVTVQKALLSSVQFDALCSRPAFLRQLKQTWFFCTIFRRSSGLIDWNFSQWSTQYDDVSQTQHFGSFSAST